MRTITANIKNLFGVDYQTKQVTFLLINRYGLEEQNLALAQKAFSKVLATTDSESILSAQLYETEGSGSDRSYLVSFADTLSPFRIYVPSGVGSIDISECLAPYKNKKMDAYTGVDNDGVVIDEAFIERLDASFVGGYLNAHDESIRASFYRCMDANSEEYGRVVVTPFMKIDEILGARTIETMEEQNG